VDEDPTPELETQLSGYQIYCCNDTSLTTAGLLETTAAVVFRQSADHPRKIADQLSRLAPTFLQHGCLVFVQPLHANEGTGNWAQSRRKFIADAIEKLQLPAVGLLPEERAQLGEWANDANTKTLTPLVQVLPFPDDWQGMLSSLQRYPPGEAHTSTTVLLSDPDDPERTLVPEHELLVRRAFWDCTEVRLEPLRNGLSRVDAYRVYAQQQVDEIGGHWPYRYFIKIGNRAQISTEYQHYRDIALEHLPYHLGPRLRLDRCALGHRHGIIVSDYVGGAEPLRDCASDGRAVGAIANLFNVTFRAWHNGAETSNVPLQDYLKERLPIKVPAFRKPLIEVLGSKRTLEELSRLLLTGKSSPVMVGVVHGDLHATNVLVRGGDAILIDFEKVEKKAPLLRDLACLEGGLFVDGFAGDCREPRTILESINCLYTPTVLHGDHFSSCHPGDGSAWFFDCVMQIRLHARHIERAPGQYALMLASELMRKACNDHNFDGATLPRAGVLPDSGPFSGTTPARLRKEQARAMAYILAEWILVG